MEGEGEGEGERTYRPAVPGIRVLDPGAHGPVLLPQLLLGDAQEFAGAVGGGEAGDGFELLVVDLGLGVEALPGEGDCGASVRLVWR